MRSTSHYARARDTLIAECEREGHITLARFRDLLGISRRPAQLLLERFDTDGITRRVGDERIPQTVEVVELKRTAKRQPSSPRCTVSSSIDVVSP